MVKGPVSTCRFFSGKPDSKNEKVDIIRHGVLSDSFGLYYPSDHLPVLVEVKIN